MVGVGFEGGGKVQVAVGVRVESRIIGAGRDIAGDESSGVAGRGVRRARHVVWRGEVEPDHLARVRRHVRREGVQLVCEGNLDIALGDDIERRDADGGELQLHLARHARSTQEAP
jgi:hypothetical protein